MVEELQDMPGQALGFRLSGKLTRDEYSAHASTSSAHGRV
jgi:hypothetical protein